MENICEWANCNESGKFKAPVERDNSRSYKWLCEEHIKAFNKNWNYFEGMSQKEIESFVKSDLTWHRPTQKFGSFDNFFNILWNNALSDKFIREDKILNSQSNKRLSEKDKKNVDKKINLILLNKIGKTSKPKKISLNSNEIKKFLNYYY